MQRFVYALDPVLTKHRWDLDSLSAELAAARQHLAQSNTAVAQARDTLAALWQQFEQIRSAPLFDVARESALRQYAERVQALLQSRLATQREAAELQERIAGEVRQALREVRGLESHRERQQQLHADASRVQLGKEADDAWLMSHPAPGAPA